ncbi:MAG TPA: hypothetical protein VHO01_16450 [Jatrophihabitans sp.]|nr:hypothetical protein [Jatrophihabitans sp.]
MLKFGEIPQGGGGWLKPVEHKDDVAILIEVKAFDHQRPTPNGPKDSALCDFTFFATQADLDAGKPSSIAQGMRVEQTILARDLQGMVGQAVIVTLTQVPPKKPGQQPAWVYRQPSTSNRDKVVTYATKREEAKAEAVAAAPDFD